MAGWLSGFAVAVSSVDPLPAAERVVIPGYASLFELSRAQEGADRPRLVTDGPFAETREQLGRYFLIDAKNIDEAIEISGRIPGARIGTVEVRPVTEVAGLPED